MARGLLLGAPSAACRALPLLRGPCEAMAASSCCCTEPLRLPPASREGTAVWLNSMVSMACITAVESALQTMASQLLHTVPARLQPDLQLLLGLTFALEQLASNLAPEQAARHLRAHRQAIVKQTASTMAPHKAKASYLDGRRQELQGGGHGQQLLQRGQLPS